MTDTADQLDLYRFIKVKPEIDYLARDYASLRQLMLDHFSVLVPDWTEGSAADLGQLLIDLVAYTGDYLSYYQDAAATEAYLGTARMRRSVRRHARLLDYFLHEGCNARAWVHVTVNCNCDGRTLPRGTLLLTDAPGLTPGAVDDRLRPGAIERGADVFATLHDVVLRSACNQFEIYAADLRRDGALHRGATKALLKIGPDPCQQPQRNGSGIRATGVQSPLQRGDVLLFEEIRDPATGEAARCNPRRRHVVRLTRVYPAPPAGPADELSGAQVVGIEWAEDDALPFDLFLVSSYGRGPVTVARGNVVLADHGSWLDMAEELPPVPAQGSYRPALRHPNLTFCTAYNHRDALALPARQVIEQDPDRAVPQIRVDQVDPTTLLNADALDALLAAAGNWRLDHNRQSLSRVLRHWNLCRDLLNSEPFAPDFVVEMEDGETAYLGFGSTNTGMKPAPGDEFLASYRVGNGARGNVGRDTICHLVLTDQLRQSLLLKSPTDIQVRNPLPARGGMNPQRTEEARLYAPAAFHVQRDSCVTAEDYANVARRYPGVANATARVRWTGTWRTVFLYVRRDMNAALTRDFRRRLRAFLEPYRYVGSEVEIRDPLFVPLTIRLSVAHKPAVPELVVLQSLQRAFDDQEHEDGTRGFFAPANFDFGKAVYRSNVIAAAMKVPGVANVQVLQFGRVDGMQVAAEEIMTSPLEIIALPNDPDRPDLGRITFTFTESA